MCEEEDDGCQREVVQQVMGIVEIIAIFNNIAQHFNFSSKVV